MTNLSDIYLARQPVFNAALEVVGYELLFRSGPHGSANVLDGNEATARVILNTFLEIGIENVTSNKLAFINLTRDYLSGSLELPLTAKNVILEVLESVELDEACVSGIRQLSQAGFGIALDDFLLGRDHDCLLPLADVVKLDTLALDRESLRSHVRELKGYPVKLLAEKVETEEEYQYCRQLGFDYFQGYFFAKPRILSARSLPPNQLVMLEVVALLQSSDCSFEDIEKIVSRDASLSYKLLRIINSSFYGLNSKVNSIQHALVMLGLSTIKKWITVMSLSMVPEKPDEVLTLSLVRARTCEQLAIHHGLPGDAAFMMGLFSMLDVLLDQPLAELIAKLPLADDVVDALLARKGPLGDLLNLVLAYETGDWESVDLQADLGDKLSTAYFDALTWTTEVTLEIGRVA